jgi:UDP-N-acetylglucosamine--N-acetylmuramyl-(pentapeptide) pyrophosphoryl-undecaprenol N-acetylglucosamine transferase
MAKVMILAGGTGGHVFPALAVAKWLKNQGHQVSWMGTPKGLEAKVVPEAGIELDTLEIQGLRGMGFLAALKVPLGLSRAWLKACAHLKRRRPQVVLGMGGFAAGPGGLAAVSLGIPLLIHEQNRVPGVTNRFLARWARRVLEGFPGTFAARFRPCWTGNPLRSEIENLASLRRPKLSQGRPVRILVLGGSQGAKALNEVVPKALSEFSRRIEVWHQSGFEEVSKVQEAYAKASVPARVSAFIADMAQAYAFADLAICRAGAMTVSELAAAGLGAIFLPYPYAVDDHQTKNAQYLVERGAAKLVPQEKGRAPCPYLLRELVKEMLETPSQLERMGEAARQAARLDATETVARMCLEEV